MSVQKFTNKTAINNNKNAQVKGRPKFSFEGNALPDFLVLCPPQTNVKIPFEIASLDWQEMVIQVPYKYN